MRGETARLPRLRSRIIGSCPPAVGLNLLGPWQRTGRHHHEMELKIPEIDAQHALFEVLLRGAEGGTGGASGCPALVSGGGLDLEPQISSWDWAWNFPVDSPRRPPHQFRNTYQENRKHPPPKDFYFEPVAAEKGQPVIWRCSKLSKGDSFIDVDPAKVLWLFAPSGRKRHGTPIRGTCPPAAESTPRFRACALDTRRMSPGRSRCRLKRAGGSPPQARRGP